MFVVDINDYPDCPLCKEKLSYSFHTQRQLKTYRGRKERYLIPVCRCKNNSCSSGFIRILPDIMTPHKHYSTEVIENVADEICTPETPETEDYPCEKTMERWKAWIDGNKIHVDGVLKSIGSRLSEFGMELLSSEISLMDELRKDGAGWLPVLNRMTWNFRLPFFNARQLKERTTDLSVVSGAADLSSPYEEEKDDGHKGSHHMAGRESTGEISDDPSADQSRYRQSEKNRTEKADSP